MRKYLRAVAHGTMEFQGVNKPNRRQMDGKSYFAKHWRKYC